MNKLIEKIELPLKENPDLVNPPKGSYHDGYKSATINILAIIKAENLAIAGVVATEGEFCECTYVRHQTTFINPKGIKTCAACRKPKQN